MTPTNLIDAARVPDAVQPFQKKLFNGKRYIDRRPNQRFSSYYALCEVNMAGLHRVDDEGFGGYVVMEDTERELARHLPFLLRASGRVLKTGLGLGCVVRALLAKSVVDHVDVVEINADIIKHFGAEFEGNSRVTIHHGDALEMELPGRWDFAWHDIYTEGNEGLEEAHARLLLRFSDRVSQQGAWQFPRICHRAIAAKNIRLLGAPKFKSANARQPIEVNSVG